jgi:hypothetical protein
VYLQYVGWPVPLPQRVVTLNLPSGLLVNFTVTVCEVCNGFAEIVLEVDDRILYSDLLRESDDWEQASKECLHLLDLMEAKSQEYVKQRRQRVREALDNLLASS